MLKGIFILFILIIIGGVLMEDEIDGICINHSKCISPNFKTVCISDKKEINLLIEMCKEITPKNECICEQVKNQTKAQ